MSPFNLTREFRCRCARPTCSAPIQPHWLLVSALETARGYYGAPLIVTSGNRCPEHNHAVDGEDPSEHVWPDGCLGCDLECTTSRARWRLMEALTIAGFRRMGIYADHVHAGVGERVDAAKFPADLVWLPGGTPA